MSTNPNHFSNSQFPAQNEQNQVSQTIRFSSQERAQSQNKNQLNVTLIKLKNQLQRKKANIQCQLNKKFRSDKNAKNLKQTRDITIVVESLQEKEALLNLRPDITSHSSSRERMEVDDQFRINSCLQIISEVNNDSQIHSNLQTGLPRNQQEERFTVRDERGQSFCETISSSKSSSRGSNSASSINLEDDSSDAGASSHEDDIDRLSTTGGRGDYDDEDLDSKIKWFFKRIEQEEKAEIKSLNTSTHNESLNSRDHQESFSTLGDTYMHNTTHEDTNTSTDENTNSLLGKRKRDVDMDESSCQKRIKQTDKADNTVETLEKQESEEKEMSESKCFFPQFKEEFEKQMLKKRDAKKCKDSKIGSSFMWTPELPKLSPLVSTNLGFSTPQISQKLLQKEDSEKQANNTKQQKMQIFEKANLLSKNYKGECLSTSYSICKGNNALKFKCQNNHTFFIAADIIESLQVASYATGLIQSKSSKSVETAASSQSPKITTATNDDWCYKCRKFFNTCKEVAAQNGIVVVEGLYNTKITLKCEKKHHQFKISYSKKLNTLTCSDCRKEEREEWKEQLRQEEQRRNEFYQRKQQELFEQARREMEGDHQGSDCGQGQQQRSQTGSSWQSSSSSSSTRRSYSYYASVEEQVNLQAQKLTVEYIKKNKDNNNSSNNNSCPDSEKIFIVYKFIQTPIEALIAGMQYKFNQSQLFLNSINRMQMQRDQAIQYFRRLAKLLHPDKNQHPLAKEAFQKLSEAVQAVSSSSASAAKC